MQRTLYLHENRDMRVLRDGPSVWIEMRGRAGQRIPVRMVGRVVIVGKVTIDASVVTLFTARDVPVVFMEREGGEHAMALPSKHRLPAHYGRQTRLVASEDAAAAYRRWAETKRQVIQTGVLKKLFPGLARNLRLGVGEGNYTRLVAGLMPKDSDRRNLVCSAVSRLFAAVVTERATHAGLDCHIGVIHRRHNFGLVADLCHIIEAEIDLQCIEFFRRARRRAFLRRKGLQWKITRMGIMDMVDRFERKRSRIINIVDVMADEIFTLMRETGT